jgi:hypothetical protein
LFVGLACGFGVGVVVALTLAPSRRVPIVAAVPEALATAAPSAPVDRACRTQLASVKVQLAACHAARPAEPEGSDTPIAKLADPGWDEETMRLVRTGTTNTTQLAVRTECGIRIYAPGTWPPPDGPPPGARIAWMSVDGGIELHARDGGVTFVAQDPRAVSGPQDMYCPCSKSAPDGGATP